MRLLARDKVRKIIDLCHEHGVYVSTGGFVERVIAQGSRAVDLYLEECKALGFDVVEVGTTAATRDTTLVLDRSRHPEWARNVASSLGRAAVESRPDSSRYLDVTVLVGASWRPPAQPFYP